MQGIQLIIPGLPLPIPRSKLKPFKHFHECFCYFRKMVNRSSRTQSEHGAYILSILEKEGVCIRDGNKYDFWGEDTRKLFNRYYADEIINQVKP